MQSAHVKIELNPEVLERVIAELKLKRPPTFTLHSTGRLKTKDGVGRYRGLYDPARNHVTVANGSQAYSRERQIELVKHIQETVLHELRHAWQRENWTPAEQLANAAGPYHLRVEEIDANDWADYARPMFPGLVKVTRRPVGGKSRFAKTFEKHERSS